MNLNERLHTPYITGENFSRHAKPCTIPGIVFIAAHFSPLFFFTLRYFCLFYFYSCLVFPVLHPLGICRPVQSQIATFVTGLDELTAQRRGRRISSVFND